MSKDAKGIHISKIWGPIPDGDETIIVEEAGVVTLTPPNIGSAKAIITNPVDCYIRFDSTPSNGMGRYFPANSGIVFESTEEIKQARIYVSAACTLFVDYSR